MTLPAELADLVARQSGVATRKQLLDGGVTIAQIRWALGRRWRIQRSHPRCLSSKSD